MPLFFKYQLCDTYGVCSGSRNIKAWKPNIKRQITTVKLKGKFLQTTPVQLHSATFCRPSKRVPLGRHQKKITCLKEIWRYSMAGTVTQDYTKTAKDEGHKDIPRLSHPNESRNGN